MKKINLCLIVITILCGVIVSFTQIDRGIVVLLKNLSIILTILVPYIFTKVTKMQLDDSFNTLWIVFIFLSHFLGVIVGWYNTVPYFDKVTHTISGVLTSYIAYIILQRLGYKNLMFNILFIFAFSALCACVWEIFEYTCNIFVGGDAQRVALTGVNDTMQDMIVAMVGTLVFSVYYYFKVKKNKCL